VKPCPIGPWSSCFAHHGISNPLALLLWPTKAVLPQTPHPSDPMFSAGLPLKACQAGDPQTFTISTRPHPQACTGLNDLCFAGTAHQACHAWDTHMHDLRSAGAGPSRPAQACTSSVSLGCTTQACMISAVLGHAHKACHTKGTHTHYLHSTGLCPPGLHRPAQYPLWKPVPLGPAKMGTNTCTISVPLGHIPQACQARDPQTCRSPLRWHAPFRHAKPILQRPDSSPQLKAST
jgi:hypothetical protein